MQNRQKSNAKKEIYKMLTVAFSRNNNSSYASLPISMNFLFYWGEFQIVQFIDHVTPMYGTMLLHNPK